jgi:hypothetical protein
MDCEACYYESMSPAPISIPNGKYAQLPISDIVGLAADGTTQLPLTQRTASVDDYAKLFVAVVAGGSALAILGKTSLAPGATEDHVLTINAKGSDGVTVVPPATIPIVLNGPPPPPQAASIGLSETGLSFGTPDIVGPHDPGAGTVSF